MYNAIQKYGWENIKHEILFEGLTYEEANAKEMELIAKYKTNCRRYGDAYGYNMTDGGDGTKGHALSEESKAKMIAAHLGKTGKECPNSKVVICDGVEYDSLTEFRNKNNVSKNVSAWLSGKVTMPKYWYDKGLYYKDQDVSVIRCREKQEYDIFVFDGKTFNGQIELSQYLNISPATLCDWIKGIHKAPKDIVDKGIYYISGEKVKLIPQNKSFKTKIFYDGKIYESQRELARYLNIKPATLNSWLLGKNSMPEKYKDKNLHIYKEYSDSN